MPLCAWCGKKVGGIFSHRVFNKETGRCSECDLECDKQAELTLDRFREKFHSTMKAGTLTEHHWSELEEALAATGLDRKGVLAYVRRNLFALLRSVLQGEAKVLSQDVQLQYLVQLLAIPDHYIQQVRQVLAESKEVVVACGMCGAEFVALPAATEYSCPNGCVVALRRCFRCSRTLHIEQELWGGASKCPFCGILNSWGAYSPKVRLGDVAKSLKEDQILVADSNRRVVAGIVIGGSGYPVPVKASCQLEFASEKVFINALSERNQYSSVASDEYAAVISLQFEGPGVVTSGGGWCGGGFGPTGIISGVVLAAVLNEITTRSTIKTIIYFRTTVGELILFNNQYTRQDLRNMLSPAITRIEAAQRRTVVPPPSIVNQLRELGELRATGTITEEEFQRLKATLLKSIDAE